MDDRELDQRLTTIERGIAAIYNQNQKIQETLTKPQPEEDIEEPQELTKDDQQYLQEHPELKKKIRVTKKQTQQ